MPTPSYFPGPGEDVGPYRLVRQLGQGGMGVVFEAEDPGLARRVAVKIISIHLADDPEFRARFTREAQAQASLDSAHVVRVYSHGEADGRLYIATQLVPDGDLGAMLRGHGAAPPWLALDLTAQIATGLADAHEAGLIHRDLKPANVLLRRRGKAFNGYLTDFGIARHVDRASGLTKSGAAVGTPSYMAPELHTGGEAGVASDVYSLGCLLWATLTGGPPFPGRTEFEVINNHVTGPVPRLRDDGPAARELGDLLARLLAKDPADRPASAEDVAAQLRDAAGRAPDAVTAVDRAEPTPTPASWSPAPGRPTPSPAPSGPPSPTPPPADLPPPLPPGAMPHPTPTPPPAGPPRSPRSSRRPVLLALVGLALLVVVGVGLAVVLTRGNDGGSPSGGGDGTTTSASPDRPTSSYYDDLSDEEAVVAANIADVLVSQEGTDRDAAECVSARTVRDRGVDSLQEDGLVRDDLTVDTEAPGSAGFLVSSAVAAVTCVLDGAGASS